MGYIYMHIHIHIAVYTYTCKTTSCTAKSCASDASTSSLRGTASRRRRMKVRACARATRPHDRAPASPRCCSRACAASARGTLRRHPPPARRGSAGTQSQRPCVPSSFRADPARVRLTWRNSHAVNVSHFGPSSFSFSFGFASPLPSLLDAAAARLLASDAKVASSSSSESSQGILPSSISCSTRSSFVGFWARRNTRQNCAVPSLNALKLYLASSFSTSFFVVASSSARSFEGPEVRRPPCLVPASGNSFLTLPLRPLLQKTAVDRADCARFAPPPRPLPCVRVRGQAAGERITSVHAQGKACRRPRGLNRNMSHAAACEGAPLGKRIEVVFPALGAKGLQRQLDGDLLQCFGVQLLAHIRLEVLDPYIKFLVGQLKLHTPCSVRGAPCRGRPDAGAQQARRGSQNRLCARAAGADTCSRADGGAPRPFRGAVV